MTRVHIFLVISVALVLRGLRSEDAESKDSDAESKDSDAESAYDALLDMSFVAGVPLAFLW